MTVPWTEGAGARCAHPAPASPAYSDELPCFGQYVPEDPLDLGEVGLVADQRGRELHDRVSAVVGTAVQPGLEERPGKEAAQQALGLVGVERLLRGLVLDQ